MPAISSDMEFLKLVRKSGLLSEEAIQQFVKNFPETLVSPKFMAEAMVKQGLITTFQSKVLLSGRHSGFILGAYKVLEPIGKGGMGRIFLAEHCTMHRRVAIKVLDGSKAKNEEMLQRFYREARSAAALDHPNIVKLYDVNQGAGTHFLVMEYVQGVNLQQIVKAKGPLHYQKAIRYIIHAATGLKHAHEKGFIHRDIKPDNIMRSNEGVIKILDMGLARSLLEEKDNLTKMLNPNAIYGTVDYISPEQSIGGTVDKRSDLYSLGATLFTLITGVAPFSGTAPQVLLSHQLDDVPNLTDFCASVPPQLNAIVAKLMAKQPDKRYRNASEVIEALLPWLTTAHGSQTPISSLPGIGNYDSGVQEPSATSRQTKSQKPNSSKEKNKRFISVSPKVALAIVGSGLGLALVILFLILVTGSSKEQGSISFENQPFQSPNRPESPLINYVSKNPRKDVVEANCVYLDLRPVANVISTKHIFIPGESDTATNSIPLSTWGQSNYHGVPFDLIDPQGNTVPNILVFGGGDTPFTKDRRTVASLSCNAKAKVIHVLGGISGWAYPHIKDRVVFLLARIHYKNGQTEEHKLYNGVHFADWKMPYGDVPSAPVVVQMDRERHLRYFSIEPKSREEISRIEFIKGDNQSAAPIFFAITVEKP